MDAQATWDELLDAWNARDWPPIHDSAEHLRKWLNQDGFAPKTMGARQFGADWDGVLALSICEFVVARAKDVLDSPNRIPFAVPFTLTCSECNNEGPPTYAKSAEQGWTNIQYVPAGVSENFLGQCPICCKLDSEA